MFTKFKKFFLEEENLKSTFLMKSVLHVKGTDHKEVAPETYLKTWKTKQNAALHKEGK